MDRVYLDQKDFSRMAQGASGAPAYANDREAHTVLTGLVEKGAVTIYFSSSHIVEALRYKGDRADRLNAYCEVVDTLTRGHCLVIANELRRRELEIHLAREFSFHTALDAESFAFGKHADALSADPVTGPSMKELVRAAVRRDLAARGDLNRNQRRRLLAKIEKDSGLRTLFEQFPDETFDEMLRLFPFLPPNSTRAHVMDLIFSSGEKNARAERDFADGLAQFRYLVGKYGNQHPDLRELGQLPDEEAVTLNQIIETAQDLFDSTGVFVDANEIGRTLTRRFVEHLRPAISLHAERSGFSCDDAIEWLVGDGFGRLPSVRVIPLLVRAYLARHKGVPGKARKPRENDLMDMQHLRALPYVNHLVTDGFWADAARSVAVVWGTKVYRTSKELAVALQAQFG